MKARMHTDKHRLFYRDKGDEADKGDKRVFYLFLKFFSLHFPCNFSIKKSGFTSIK